MSLGWIWIRYKGFKGLKSKKSSPNKNPRCIYHSIGLSELITNIYVFDMFGLNLNMLLGAKVSKNCTFLIKVFTIRVFWVVIKCINKFLMMESNTYYLLYLYFI